MTIVDTHIHVWDLDRAEYPWLKGDASLLNNTWTLEQLEEERIKAGITSGILVQAAGNAEDTELMLETARNTAWIEGVVAWLPLMNPGETARLLKEKFLADKYIKGIRHQVHDEKDHQWLLQKPVLESLQLLAAHDLSYDVVGILPQHIETVLAVAEKIPNLRMVFDHLNWPPIPTKEKFGRWGELMKAAARNKNFYAKISGLGTASGNFQNRQEEDIKPYIAFALEQFGADRCFCGGDWPVSLLADSYTKTWQIYKQIISELLSEEEQESVLSKNATLFYKLD